ncbi:MAG: acetyl-CoA carboxylase biotin carboxyl carrier protein [Lachnospiraceae bacterium]
MDMQEIYRLMERFEQSSIGEMELEMPGAKVMLRKSSTAIGGVAFTAPDTVQMLQSTQPAQSGQKVQGEQSISKKETTETADNMTEITAPLVGTFYRAPSEDEKPYVMVGQEVKKGDVVGIIEAMKLMNEIVAAEDGVIETIDVENGSMVEYQQRLMTLSKSK